MIEELLSERGLSLERLESFCLVAEAGGVTKAARGDVTKQSQFSRQIKDLEVFFGTELMRRKGKGVELTGLGQRLHSIVREQFAALSDFKIECKGQPLEIAVGAGESIIQWLLLPKLATFRRDLPNARYKFLNLPNSEVIRRLSEGLLDFGIVRKSGVTKPLKSTLVGRMGFSLYVAKEMLPLVREKRNADVLEAVPLAILEGDGSFKRELAAIVRQNKLHLQISVECSSFTSVARALGSGAMAAILPNFASEELRKMGFLQIEPKTLKTLEREICLAWNPRQLRIRTSLEKARGVFTEALSRPI